MRLVHVLILLAIRIPYKVATFQINCDFDQSATECKVNSLFVLESDSFISSIIDTKNTSISGKNVTRFWLTEEVKTQIVPASICSLFENLKRIDIYGRNISRIARSSFTNCSKVSELYISLTKLAELPEDLFEDLIELTTLNIGSNKLKSLPANLISKNMKLTNFTASQNEISAINITFGSHLAIINLSENKCVNRVFPETIDDFNKDVFEKCGGSAFGFNDKQTEIENLKKNISSLSETNKSLLEAKASNEADITQLTKENESLKSLSDVYMKALEDKLASQLESIKLNNGTSSAVYFAILSLTFAVILAATVIFMRQSQPVTGGRMSMASLLGEEQAFL